MSKIVAGTPSMEAESRQASSTCSNTCSKDRVRHGNGGGFFKITGLAQATSAIKARHPCGLFYWALGNIQHRTFNAERSSSASWTLCVDCCALNVSQHQYLSEMRREFFWAAVDADVIFLSWREMICLRCRLRASRKITLRLHRTV